MAADYMQRSYSSYGEHGRGAGAELFMTPQPPASRAGYRPFSRKQTNYAGMNDWMPMLNPRKCGHIPQTVSAANWKTYKMKQNFYKPTVPPSDSNDFFSAYQDLSDKVAYRYPNPGLPRERQGAIGGSWRHIKQVLGYGGAQICFIDGLVRQYDTDKFNEYLQTGGRESRALPLQPKMSTPIYSLNRHNVSSYRKDLRRQIEMDNYRPWYQEANHQGARDLPTLYEATPPTRFMKPGTAPASYSKYKGTYGLKE
ncbi:uncharacterized protein LOC106159686 [Lingula anatina]|uniref:Uncharacterized protein LOC106159686 n=1 Tax=Lingula anatina TaxID=7574 RepID=A0A1S3HZS7_LINAN|nr:uncharacterized protein LOC106159686 [Lingula anatina]XP_013391520.1 uncharacterized protein LOC106159686 [Lingula anatina]|eukprot:XP_013391518.1 uncharacterized protein LOC106159686 [Lingula anatina]